MKKVYFSIASMFVGLACVTAQSFTTPSYIDRKQELPQGITPVLKHSQSATSRWYAYWNYKDAFHSNIGTIYGNYLFPDSNITAEFSGGTFASPWVHGLANVLDPTASVFNDPLLTPAGELLIRPTDAYSLDSIAINFIYERNASSIDTLVIEVNVNASPTSLTTPWFCCSPSTGQAIVNNLATVHPGIDTVFIKNVPCTPATNALNLTPKQTYKVVLDSAFHADSTTNGIHYYDFAPSGLPAVNAGRYVVMNVWFKPGYTYSLADTIANKNYARLLSMEERGGPTSSAPIAPHTYPYYEERDFNISYIMPTDVKYGTAGGWNGYFIPSFAYMGSSPDYAFENHLFAYKLSCNTCDAVSSNDIDANTSKLGLAYPNPAHLGESVMIPVTLANAGDATLKIFNAIGQEVKTINAKDLNAGINKINVNTANLNAGVYLYSLELNGNITATQRFTLVK